MSVHKYPFLNDGKQKIEGIEISRLATKDGNIPLVATAEIERIVLYWWDIKQAKWKNYQRKVQQNSNYNDYSNRVCITTYKENVFLIYKRPIQLQNNEIISNVYLEWLIYDDNQCDLVLKTVDPYIIPLSKLGYSSGSGHYIWVNYYIDNSELKILLQSISYIERIRNLYEFYPSYYTLQNRVKNLKEIIKKHPSVKKEVLKEIEKITLVEKENAVEQTSYIQIDSFSIASFTKLTLLTISFSQGIPNFEDPKLWKTVDIDNGGYNFDVKLNGKFLHCLYRREGYSVNVLFPDTYIADSRFTQEINPNINDINDEVYAYLYYRVIDLSNNQVVLQESLDNLPGGEYPLIHNLFPLLYSVERIYNGQISYYPDYVQTLPNGNEYYGHESITANIDSIQKIIIKLDGGIYYKNRLFIVDKKPQTLLDDPYARVAYMPYENIITNIKKTGVSKWMQCSLLKGYNPMYLINYEEKIKDVATFSLLHHSLRAEGIIVSKFTMVPNALNANYDGYQIFDIDNKIIIDNTPIENHQFENVTIDNTLGGALICDVGSNNFGFLAYSNLGDGGLRVIFDEEMPSPEPIAIDPTKKELYSGPIQGYSLGSDTWVEIVTNGWIQSELGNYYVGFDFEGWLTYTSQQLAALFGGPDPLPFSPEKVTIGSLGSGLHALLDSLFTNIALVTGYDPNSNSISIDQQVANDAQGLMASFFSETSLWDTLWKPYDNISNKLDDPNSSYRIRLLHCELNFAKYKLEYFKDGDERNKIVIQMKDKHGTEYKFNGSSEPQGLIDYRFKINFNADDIDVYKGLGSLFIKIRKVNVTLLYNQLFTPAILTTEKRYVSPMNVKPGLFLNHDEPEELVISDSVLTTKPYSNTSLQLPEDGLKINMNFTATYHIVGALISFLIALGLTSLVSYLTLTYASLLAAFGTPLFYVILAILITFITVVVPALVKNKIKEIITNQVSGADMKKTLDDQYIMLYAGEGLAEAIAMKIITQSSLPLDIDNVKGVNRFRSQFWQTIQVMENKCRVLIRK